MRLRLLALRSQRQASRATPGMAAVEVEAAVASARASMAAEQAQQRKRPREADAGQADARMGEPGGKRQGAGAVSSSTGDKLLLLECERRTSS